MINPGAISYATGGVAFLALSVLLATSWRGRFQGGVVVAAACLSTIWCFWLAYQASEAGTYATETFLLEVLRGGAWLSLLVGLLRDYHRRQALSRSLVYGIHAFWVLTLLYGVAVALGLHTGFPVWVVGLLAIALMGLVLLEQLYRNARPEKRWAIKFLIIGVGSIFVYDFFLYSQALLLREVNANLWNARGAVNALAVPLIAVAATRNPDWSIDIFVSRQVVFYSTALLAAGTYLLAMAAGGYYIRTHGGTWGAFAQIVFLGGAALMLVVIMLSAEVRGKVRTFLIKHFYKGKYEYRFEWLRLIRTLATPDETRSLGDRALQALAQVVESSGGALWLKQEHGEYRVVAHWDMSIPPDAVEPPHGSLARFLKEREWVIDLVQQRSDPAGYDGLSVPDWLAVQKRAWLVIPLMQESELLGFVLLLGSRTFGKLTWEDIDLLKTIGRQVASYLAHQQAAQALAEARQFDAYHRLTAFIVHDLKNLIAQQSLVVKNAARHRNNPAFIDDVIRTIDNSVTRMNQLLEQLKRGESPRSSKRVALRDLLAEVVSKHASVRPVPELEVLEDRIEVLADPEGLAAIVGHIVRNAQEATAQDGHVHVRLGREGANAVIDVEDTGAGMEPAFVAERLFRPFDSTKGSKGMGIGAYQAREFVRAAGGEVKVASAPGRGTTFRILLPILHSEQTNRKVPAVELGQ